MCLGSFWAECEKLSKQSKDDSDEVIGNLFKAGCGIRATAVHDSMLPPTTHCLTAALPSHLPRLLPSLIPVYDVAM
ncbi:hypothetical protein E2C01_005846 [Portunus trituberculatus]|uniref:Uncharacterized protein n=1 Tax=Portunus trituberculatus TaxID=210409 RepID=A0A5B7CXP1_PORTR|nr:hypothetical protein [Portunus trituberculatus]